MVLSEISNPSTPLKALEEKSDVAIYVRTDSDSLSRSVEKESGTIADKRLYVVIAALREAFTRRRNQFLHWFPTTEMMADPLTKWMEAAALLAWIGASDKIRDRISAPRYTLWQH